MKTKTGIERCKPQKKAKKMDKIFKGLCIYWITFVAIAWITYWVKDSVPDSLIQFGLGGGTVELFISGWIEIMRDKHNRRDENE